MTTSHPPLSATTRDVADRETLHWQWAKVMIWALAILVSGVFWAVVGVLISSLI